MSNPILRVVDFFDEIVESGDKKNANITICVCYTIFLICAAVVAKEFSDKDFSAVMTAGSGIQLLGFFLLLHKIKVQDSVAGISSKTLEMYMLSISLRLVSTLTQNGYLPVDRSGDFVYQACDVASLLVLAQLIWCCRKKNANTYQSEYDSLEIWRAVPGCIALSWVLHPSLNHALYYDIVWTIAMNIDTVAMLPQLWMLVAKGGEVEALTSNYIAALFGSRLCVLCFWWIGHKEMAPRDGGVNFAGYWVVVAHGLQVLMSADFMYHYLEARTAQSTAPKGCPAKPKPIVLPSNGDIVV